jgi:hypothetical protein
MSTLRVELELVVDWITTVGVIVYVDELGTMQDVVRKTMIVARLRPFIFIAYPI